MSAALDAACVLRFGRRRLRGAGAAVATSRTAAWIWAATSSKPVGFLPVCSSMY
jgi:hypothetical protein